MKPGSSVRVQQLREVYKYYKTISELDRGSFEEKLSKIEIEINMSLQHRNLDQHPQGSQECSIF